MKTINFLRPAEILVGAVFIAGALLKANAINVFAVQINYYGVLSNPDIIDIAAIGTLWVETALGSALLFGVRLRGAIPAATLALLAAFTSLIAYAWAYHGIKDCGCFGPIELSPGASIAKNVVLAALCLFAWIGSTKTQPVPRGALRGAAHILLPILLACAAAGYGGTHLEKIPAKTDGPFAQFVFEEDGEQYDLNRGLYFVPILNMTCEHCMASVEKTNALITAAGFPRAVALCYEENEGELNDFRNQTNPAFPLHSMGPSIRTFFDLIGDEPPRFYLLRDGKAVKYWDKTPPSAEEVFAALNGKG
jgi:hypothetical protein